MDTAATGHSTEAQALKSPGGPRGQACLSSPLSFTGELSILGTQALGWQWLLERQS